MSTQQQKADMPGNLFYSWIVLGADIRNYWINRC